MDAIYHDAEGARLSLPASLPLLHVARTAVTVLDERVLAAALIVLAGVMLFLWRGELARLVRASSRRRAAGRMAGVAVALALLPAVLPYDHLLFEHVPESEVTEASHEMHCHITPGSCADAPITAGPGQLLFSDPLLLALPSLILLVYLADRTLRGRTLQPDLRPPIA